MKRYLNSLYVPESFRMTCAIYHFPVYHVLQDFIDHIAVYDALHKTSHQAYHLATSTALNFACSVRRGSGQAFNNNLEQGIKHLTELIHLGMQARTTENRRRKLSRLIVWRLYSDINPGQSPTAPFYLCEDTILYFTLDFCILCELHSCHPTEILEYFMEKAGISGTQDDTPLRSIQDPAYGFFETFLRRQKKIRQLQQKNKVMVQDEPKADKISSGKLK